MLYMIVIKSSKFSESLKHPNIGLSEQMDRYNDEIEEAGIKVMAKGLHPTTHAFRLTFNEESKPNEVYKGPFEPSHEQIAGFFIIDVISDEDALYWFKKVPDPIGYGSGFIELRKIY